MLAETLDSAVCSILLVDDEKKELTVSAARCSAPDYMHRMPIRMEGSLIEYVMPDVYHTFRRGHRIMIHVQSTWFPLVDRNPQKFCDIYHAKPEDFQKATQRVYRTPDAGSSVRVQVMGTAN